MEPAGNQKIQQTYPHEELVRNTIEKNPDAKMSEIYSIALKNIANEDEKKSFNENFCVCYHRIRPFNYPSKEESEPYRIIAKMMSETSGRKCYKG